MTSQGGSKIRDIAIIVTLCLNIVGLSGAALKGLEWVATVNTNQEAFQRHQAEFQTNQQKLIETVDAIRKDVEKIKMRHAWEDAIGKAPPPRKHRGETDGGNKP